MTRGGVITRRARRPGAATAERSPRDARATPCLRSHKTNNGQTVYPLCVFCERRPCVARASRSTARASRGSARASRGCVFLSHEMSVSSSSAIVTLRSVSGHEHSLTGHEHSLQQTPLARPHPTEAFWSPNMSELHNVKFSSTSDRTESSRANESFTRFCVMRRFR